MGESDGRGTMAAASEPLGQLDWNFSQVFGERTPGEEVQDGEHERANIHRHPRDATRIDDVAFPRRLAITDSDTTLTRRPVPIPDRERSGHNQRGGVRQDRGAPRDRRQGRPRRAVREDSSVKGCAGACPADPSVCRQLAPATTLRTRARRKFAPRIRVDRARSTRRSRIHRAPNRTICPSRRRFPARRARGPSSRLRHLPPRHAAKIPSPKPDAQTFFWRRRRPTRHTF